MALKVGEIAPQISPLCTRLRPSSSSQVRGFDVLKRKANAAYNSIKLS